MKATIEQLWDTYRDLISYDNSDTDRPQSISDLKKCENVLVGSKIQGTRMYEVLIDDRIIYVTPTAVNHPCGGKMYILEVN